MTLTCRGGGRGLTVTPHLSPSAHLHGSPLAHVPHAPPDLCFSRGKDAATQVFTDADDSADATVAAAAPLPVCCSSPTVLTANQQRRRRKKVRAGRGFCRSDPVFESAPGQTPDEPAQLSLSAAPCRSFRVRTARTARTVSPRTRFYVYTHAYRARTARCRLICTDAGHSRLGPGGVSPLFSPAERSSTPAAA